MAYFVTGATGFIGRYLVLNLLKRGGPVYVLVRKGSEKKLAAARERWGADDKQVIGVPGDLGEARPRRRRGRREEAQGQGRPSLPSRRDLRPHRERGGTADRERRRNPERRPLRRDGQGRLLPSRELDRSGRALRGHLPRGHVRGSRGARPSLFQDEARFGGRSCAANAGGRSASTVPGSSSATRRPARSTRSTGRTTSSRRCRRCAACFRRGCR